MLVGVLGLAGLWVYVFKTRQIAQATLDHNRIISRPAITVSVVDYDPEDYEPTGYRPYEHVHLRIQNHASIHAKMKINYKYYLRQSYKDVTVKTSHGPTQRAYDGEKLWTVSAIETLDRHLVLNELSAHDIRNEDDITLDICIQSGPYGDDTFFSHPPMQYRWNHMTNKWERSPVKED